MNLSVGAILSTAFILFVTFLAIVIQIVTPVQQEVAFAFSDYVVNLMSPAELRMFGIV